MTARLSLRGPGENVANVEMLPTPNPISNERSGSVKMQLVQRQYDNLATMPCIVRVAIAMIPIGLFSFGCAIMYMLCSELVEQGQSLRLLFTGDDRVLFYLCVAFVPAGLFFGVIVLYAFFGINSWIVDGETFSRKSTLFGITLRKWRWSLAEIDNPQLVHITSGGVDAPRPMGARNSRKSSCDEWVLSVRNKASRRSERICQCGTRNVAEELFDFLRSAMLLRSSDE